MRRKETKMRERGHFKQIGFYLLVPLILVIFAATDFLTIQSCRALEPPRPEETKTLRRTGK
jgi:hypothetical protein